ncbi:Hypothetical predicted protein, partial [Pelobates cultripes]
MMKKQKNRPWSIGCRKISIALCLDCGRLGVPQYQVQSIPDTHTVTEGSLVTLPTLLSSQNRNESCTILGAQLTVLRKDVMGDRDRTEQIDHELIGLKTEHLNPDSR